MSTLSDKKGTKMVKNLESLLKGIDLTRIENLPKAEEILNNKKQEYEGRREPFKKELALILGSGDLARLAKLAAKAEIFKKEEKALNADHDAYMEAVNTYTKIDLLYAKEDMTSRVLIFVLGADNVIYKSELELQNMEYLDRNEETEIDPKTITKKVMIEHLVDERTKNNSTPFRMYFVSNPLNKISSVNLEEQAAFKLLEEYAELHPEIKARMEMTAQQEKEELEKIQMLESMSQTFGQMGLPPGLVRITEIHVVEEGPMTQEKYKICTETCPKKEKCESYKVAKEKFGGN